MEQGRGSPRVRALHTSPRAPVLDLYVDGSPAFVGLAYGEVSDYAEFPAGRHRFEAFPMDAAGRGRPVTARHLELRAGQDYTLALLGRPAAIESLPLVDSTPQPGEGRAKVRLLHASPDAPALDLGTRGGRMLFRRVSFAEATPFQEIAAGRHDLEVRPSGREQVLMTLPYYTLAEASLHTLVALGLVTGEPGFMIMPLVEAVAMRLPA